MSRTYREDKMLYDPYSVETRNLTRELDRLNKEIECLRSKSFENAPDFSQSTPINQATWPRQSDSGFRTSIIPDPDFGTGSNILQSSNVGKGAAKSKVMPRPAIPDKHIPASIKLAPEMKNYSDSVFETNFVTERLKKNLPKPQDKLGAYRGDNKSKNIIKPATFDGQGSLIDYKSHFDACSRINGWTESEKGLYLAVSLRGQAQGVLGNLPTDKRQDFKELVMSLEERFSPANQTELYRTQLRERRQKASESLPELGQDIRRLANLSYPTAPNDVRETLAKEQFIDGLMSVDMRLRIKQARPADLNDAIRHAVELEAFNKAEIKQDNGKGYSRAITRDGTNSDASDKTVELLKNMQTALTDLQQEVRALKQTRAQYQNHKNRGCFNCGKFGHFKKDCPDSSVKRGHPNSQNLPEVSHEKQNGVIGVNKLANEAGMFIEAKVNGCKAKMLIDTGATVSLISKKMFDSMKSQVLSPMDREILTANGSPLILFGKTIIDIDLNGHVCSNIAVVADLNVDGILGIDFQRSQNCVINITKGSIWVNGRENRLHFEGQIGCYRVDVATTIKLPPTSEVMVSRNIKKPVIPKPEVGIIIINKDQEKSKLICYQCNRRYKKTAYHRRHMTRCHQGNGAENFELPKDQDETHDSGKEMSDLVELKNLANNDENSLIQEKVVREPKTDVETVNKMCLKTRSTIRPSGPVKFVAPRNEKSLDLLKFLETVNRYIGNNKELKHTVQEEFSIFC
ncbi:unnamed protein product [Mytilus edulis]|uniref:CCHC-type domain-containing protein n=2 Tax=Mytilus edulis TaxID=6550 RepID=A0A8S3SL93_MYTED|nr:unnamed protein product [Mytilus edulis]